MAIAQNFPAISPSLSLDFAAVQALDPRITFSRASTATYYGTETAKAEENLLIRSQEFNTSPWAGTNVTVNQNTGDTTAPDGTSTAAKFTAVATTANHFRTQIPAATVNGETYTNSLHAKKGTHNFVQIYLSNQSGGFANFNLDAGVVGTTGGIVGASIVDVGNGWYRCVVTWVASGTNRYGTIKIAQTASDTYAMNWAAAGTESLYVWGAQVEQRSAVTAYTPTTDQPITNYIPVLESAASGEARFDHNPNTFESLGLLIEEQRTNLLLRSEEFENAAWTKLGGSITANTIVAPNGTLTGDKLVTNNGVIGSQATCTISYTSGVAYTLSIYAKAVEGMNVISFTVEARAAVEFNLSTNATTVTAQLLSWTVTNPQIVDVGNGWKRVSAVFTAGDTVSTNTRMAEIRTSIGNGFNGVYFWGAQLEAGAFPTSYIPTSASQVTRAADAASMTGANFSSWYNQAAGTFYGEYLSAVAAPDVAVASDNTVANRFGIISANAVQARVTYQNSSVLADAGTTLVGLNKVAGAANVADGLCGALNGVATASQTVANMPVVSRLYLGQGASGLYSSTRLHIRKIAYYPVRIQNSQLQALTS